jgi:hypothetical protein
MATKVQRRRAHDARSAVRVESAFGREVRRWPQPERATRGAAVTTYRMVYGDDEKLVTETYENVEVEREDGWVVLFRDKDAILRVREEHVRSLEEVT